MGCAYKNLWSLNTDEAVVAGILRNAVPKHVDVFMPLNAQLKDIDLLLINLRTKKSLTIQVKGSRAYEPKKSEIEKNQYGSAGWFYFHADIIHKCTADLFIFLIYVLEESGNGRRNILPHTLAIPSKELRKLCRKYKKLGKNGMYNFFFWIDPVKRKSFEFRDMQFDTSKFLDAKGLQVIDSLLN